MFWNGVKESSNQRELELRPHEGFADRKALEIQGPGQN